ncbi:hypothetical protein AB1Y20_022007 [Prymnesium parvum]|uniref:Glycosyl transferase CAP10 domain-containing protein n=1 Tax=Prymnesium parvum TaxID=97485 RepID=A0AB34JHJ3_PRYPA
MLAALGEDLRRWHGITNSVRIEDTEQAYYSLPRYARARYQIVGGQLYAARARCVHRRDETTAWALLQMLERFPSQPDVDVVLNCRDGPLLRRRRPSNRKQGTPPSAHLPLVLSYSTTARHQEIAFPDYTLWGLPGKLKPWSQLRLDLLHRASLQWEEKRPRMFGSGIVNAYHSSVGVRTREKLQKCRDPRLTLHYHRLYFERFYSTEEHCSYKYILLSPGSHALWLDHMKQKMLCGSAVFLLEPARADPAERQYDFLTRQLKPGVHYFSLPMTPAMLKLEAPADALCALVSDALDWAERHEAVVRKLTPCVRRALVRDAMSMEDIYRYMSAALAAASKLLAYHPRAAIRLSNSSLVPPSAARFRKWLRNDTDTYPITARIREEDWAAVVLYHNYSAMGISFANDARALAALTARLQEEQRALDAARRRNATLLRRRGGGARAWGRRAGDPVRRRTGRPHSQKP